MAWDEPLDEEWPWPSKFGEVRRDEGPRRGEHTLALKIMRAGLRSIDAVASIPRRSLAKFRTKRLLD